MVSKSKYMVKQRMLVKSLVKPPQKFNLTTAHANVILKKNLVGKSLAQISFNLR